MSWNHDLMPIEYLEKRLRYYKRRHTLWSNWLKETAVVTNGKIAFKMLRKPKTFTTLQIKHAVKRTHEKVLAFEDAIKKLKSKP